MILAMGNTHGMKMCFFLQVLDTFYEFQKNLPDIVLHQTTKVKQDLHLFILEILKNLYAELGSPMRI